ncbi:hypothetical protein LEP1GSC133_0685 [Leptospira borgpetersenii serovar Pomona str. 200901868]|uniref:Uncharacterized protein n=1 Tax=Leptospira borgpetersenii serovar Pomona str. 200901868 TaxID=1192866 RepID=M6W7K1_LEPBO|nr:hypothetical protein LEP1GSC133_0685 [Leptospira borgpetersenii serovar Pomona str. 200901868]
MSIFVTPIPLIHKHLRIQRTEDRRTRFARSRQRTETEELLHHGFKMQLAETKKQTVLEKQTTFRVQKTEDRGQRTETGEIVHHGFRMQFTFRRQRTERNGGDSTSRI